VIRAVNNYESLTAMGHANPFFERAGFTRVGVIRKSGAGDANGAYGAKRARLSAETVAKSRFSDPVYYVFDNRGRSGLSATPAAG
jgi:hypothetical protein